MEQAEQEQLKIENALIGIRLSIQFKEFLLSKDVNSRAIILEHCYNWFLLEEQRMPYDSQVHECAVWFQNSLSINFLHNSFDRKKQITDIDLWNNLHYELSKCPSFLKLMKFILGGIAPSQDLS